MFPSFVDPSDPGGPWEGPRVGTVSGAGGPSRKRGTPAGNGGPGGGPPPGRVRLVLVGAALPLDGAPAVAEGVGREA